MRLGFMPGILLCGGASLVSAQPLPDSLRACAAESDSLRRLICYDREVARLTPPKPALDTAPSPVSTPAAAAPAAAPAGEFGLDQERVAKLRAQEGSAEPKALTAHITAVSQLPYGRQRIALDNAQVWEQTEENWAFNPPAGTAATITRGTFGGFWMTTDAHTKVRVKRIR